MRRLSVRSVAELLGEIPDQAQHVLALLEMRDQRAQVPREMARVLTFLHEEFTQLVHRHRAIAAAREEGMAKQLLDECTRRVLQCTRHRRPALPVFVKRDALHGFSYNYIWWSICPIERIGSFYGAVERDFNN